MSKLQMLKDGSLQAKKISTLNKQFDTHLKLAAKILLIQNTTCKNRLHVVVCQQNHNEWCNEDKTRCQ